MKRLVGASVVAVLVAVFAVALAEEHIPKILVGTWEGELHVPRDRYPSERTLVIKSLRLEGTNGSAEALYGVSGGKLAAVTVAVEVSGQVVTLKFSTGVNARITVTLQDEKSLNGTYQSPDPRIQRPIKFVKVQ